MSDLPTNKPPKRKPQMPKIDWDRAGEIFGFISLAFIFITVVWVLAIRLPQEDAAQEAKTIKESNQRVLAACGPDGLRKFKIINGGKDIYQYDYEDESRETARICLGIGHDTGP